MKIGSHCSWASHYLPLFSITLFKRSRKSLKKHFFFTVQLWLNCGPNRIWREGDRERKTTAFFPKEQWTMSTLGSRRFRYTSTGVSRQVKDAQHYFRFCFIPLSLSLKHLPSSLSYSIYGLFLFETNTLILSFYHFNIPSPLHLLSHILIKSLSIQFSLSTSTLTWHQSDPRRLFENENSMFVLCLSRRHFRSKQIHLKSFPLPGKGVREGGRERERFGTCKFVRVSELFVVIVRRYCLLFYFPLSLTLSLPPGCLSFSIQSF